jgi:hypothetical protein
MLNKDAKGPEARITTPLRILQNAYSLPTNR